MLDKSIADNYFIRLHSNNSLLTNGNEIINNRLPEHSFIQKLQVYDDSHVVFSMSSFKNQAKMWEKADVKIKMKYWNILQENFNIYEHRQDESSSFNDESEQSSQKDIHEESQELKLAHLNLRRSQEDKSDTDSNLNSEVSKSSERVSETVEKSMNDLAKEIKSNEQKVSKIQLKLFKYNTDGNQIYQLWFEEFDMKHKSILWNSLDYSVSYLTQILNNNKTRPSLKSLCGRLNRL